MNYSQENISTPPNRVKFIIASILLGLMIGYALYWVMRFSWLYALLLVVVTVLLMLSLNSMRIWIMLLATSTLSVFRYDLYSMTLRPEHLVLITMIAGVIVLFVAGNFRLSRVPMVFPLTLFIVVNFVSSYFFSIYQTSSIQSSFLLLLFALMYVVTIFVVRANPQRYLTVIWIILGIAVLQAVFACVDQALFFTGVDLGVHTAPVDSTTNIIRASGGFQEANLLGAFLAASGLILLALMTSRKKFFKTNIYPSLSLITILAGMILTYTRTAWIGFAVGAIILFFMQRSHREIFNPRMAVVILALFLVIAITLAFMVGAGVSGVFEPVFFRFGGLFDFGGGSAAGRAEVQSVALARWKNNAVLLGEGTMSLPWEEALPSPAGPWLYSSTIQALHDTGLIGLALLIWFQLGLLWLMVRAYLREIEPLSRSILAGLITATLALLICSQASSFIWLGFPWIFLGFGAAYARQVLDTEK